MNSKLKTPLIVVVLFVISTAASYFLFSNVFPATVGKKTSVVPSSEVTKDGRITFDASLPKTEACPLNGAMYSKPQRQWWEKHRPLGVMIENHQESRPQSGLTSADVVYEAVAEGGITRFLAIFHCQDAGIIGPVRSARTYFLDFVSEYGDFPLYTHVGGANTSGPADALSQIEDYGWQTYNDINQFSVGFPTFWRDYERLGHPVATEHTMYSTTQKLWEVAKTRKLTNMNGDGDKWDSTFIPYKFKNDSPASAPSANKISYDIWDGYKEYSVVWNYDKTTNSYFRSNGGKKHLDKNDSKQVSSKNVIVLFMRESRANDGYEGNLHILYGTKGTGNAVVFLDGKRINGTWSKKDRESRLLLRDSLGRNIELNKGQVWFSILPIGNTVTAK